jgi:hypothetical protein
VFSRGRPGRFEVLALGVLAWPMHRQENLPKYPSAKEKLA